MLAKFEELSGSAELSNSGFIRGKDLRFFLGDNPWMGHAGLPKVLADLMTADDALRQTCPHHAAYEAKRRAELAAEASKAKLYVKRRNRKKPGLKEMSSVKATPVKVRQKQWKKSLSLQQEQDIANDIFKQLVGEGS